MEELSIRSAVRPILVVEDNDDDFESLSRALSRLNIRNPIHRAITGDECVAYLREVAARRAGTLPPPDPLPLGWSFLPALVLLDLNLPGMDGRQAIKLIKRDQDLRVIPIIVLTSSRNPVDVLECYDAGGNGYTVKPMDYEDLLKTVRALSDFWLGAALLP